MECGRSCISATGEWRLRPIGPGAFRTHIGLMGSVYAAETFEAAGRDLGSLDDAFGGGDFDGFCGWLGENIHRHGMRYRSGEITIQEELMRFFKDCSGRKNGLMAILSM